jgi:hypothetical protein
MTTLSALLRSTAECAWESRMGDRLIAGDVQLRSHRIPYVSTLFVDEKEHHCRGLGHRLIEAVEEQDQFLDSTLIRLDTFDFQVPGFTGNSDR